MRAAGILAAAALFLCAHAGHAASIGTSPKGQELPIEKAAVKFAADVKEGGYKVVTTDELKKWLDQGKKILIISSLPAAEDKEFGTLPSAVGGPMPKTEKDLTQSDKDNLLKVAGTDKDGTIVLYCGFVACRRSHIGAKILVDNGFTNVYRYPGGITAWQETGYPVTK
jgi:rhodanese-related sulfurtransferase